MMFMLRSRGFALPTVILISVIMLVVLTSAVAASASMRTALMSQYYDQLAREAAESGITRSFECIRANGMAGWSQNNTPLTPALQCDGTTASGNGLYISQFDTYRTTFSAETIKNSDDTVTDVRVTGSVQLIRSSNSSVWRTYTETLTQKIDATTLSASVSATGRNQVCGVIDANTWCWGQNDYGQLGNGTTQSSNTPVRVTREAGVLSGKIDTDLAVGDGFACSVSGGEAYCWGRNNRGQLGNGTVNDSTVPVKVSMPAGSVTQIVATEATACAIMNANAYCWGANDYGELGIGVTGRRLEPTQTTVIGASRSLPVTKIATTPLSKSVCAVSNERAYCWGRNSVGQVGDGTTTQRLAPVAVRTAGVLGNKSVTDIAVGGAPSGSVTERGHACAVANGNVYCWGANHLGQLGIGTTSPNSLEPVQVTSGLPAGSVSQVAVGYSSSCALTDNEVKCWGYNPEGQVGDGTTTNRTVPTPITVATPGLAGKTITGLIAGVNRGCVVASSITYCWGRNIEGQIGDGTNINRLVPTEATFLRRRAPLVTF